MSMKAQDPDVINNNNFITYIHTYIHTYTNTEAKRNGDRGRLRVGASHITHYCPFWVSNCSQQRRNGVVIQAETHKGYGACQRAWKQASFLGWFGMLRGSRCSGMLCTGMLSDKPARNGSGFGITGTGVGSLQGTGTGGLMGPFPLGLGLTSISKRGQLEVSESFFFFFFFFSTHPPIKPHAHSFLPYPISVRQADTR